MDDAEDGAAALLPEREARSLSFLLWVAMAGFVAVAADATFQFGRVPESVGKITLV